jgi:hypothetical protein
MKYGIYGIKYQEELEKLPLFNKKAAEVLIGKRGKNLDQKILSLLNQGYLISLKKGWYVSQIYLEKNKNKESYGEYLANKLRKPSYLSAEYMLSRYGLIPEAINIWTSITLKTTRTYENKIGTFSYKNIKNELFIGYESVNKEGYRIYQATKAKSLFDFLYLKTNLSSNLTYELTEGLRINWEVFSKSDLGLFSQYARLAKTKKMTAILAIIKEIKNAD